VYLFGNIKYCKIALKVHGTLQWNPDVKICYAKYYPDGSVSDVYTFPGILSDCDPMYEDGGIHWYTTGKPGEWDKRMYRVPFRKY